MRIQRYLRDKENKALAILHTNETPVSQCSFIVGKINAEGRNAHAQYPPLFQHSQVREVRKIAGGHVLENHSRDRSKVKSICTAKTDNHLG